MYENGEIVPDILLVNIFLDRMGFGILGLTAYISEKEVVYFKWKESTRACIRNENYKKLGMLLEHMPTGNVSLNKKIREQYAWFIKGIVAEKDTADLKKATECYEKALECTCGFLIKSQKIEGTFSVREIHIYAIYLNLLCKVNPKEKEEVISRFYQLMQYVNVHYVEEQQKVKISKLYEFDGLNKVDVEEANIGSIVAISGIADIHIGDTICSVENPVAIPFQKISEPTLSMNFIVNDSPLAGQEGKFITSRHLRDRLFRELNTDVSLRVEETDSPDSYKVSGRGELHLSVLIENMRREGYEFAVSKAEVLYHTDENGKKLEPMELAYVDVPDEYTGAVIDKLSQRKGEMINMKPLTGGYTRLEFNIPSRGLIGYRGEFMTDTRGNGIINTIFNGYDTYRGDIAYRQLGSLIAFESGESVTYGLFSAQDRGTLFIGPGEKVYAGMVIGQNGKAEDIELNVCKTKHLTNTRSSSADEALRLTPPRILSLEEALDFIDTDELLEVTPETLRIRKKILDSRMRKRSNLK